MHGIVCAALGGYEIERMRLLTCYASVKLLERSEGGVLGLLWLLLALWAVLAVLLWLGRAGELPKAPSIELCRRSPTRTSCTPTVSVCLCVRSLLLLICFGSAAEKCKPTSKNRSLLPSSREDAISNYFTIGLPHPTHKAHPSPTRHRPPSPFPQSNPVTPAQPL